MQSNLNFGVGGILWLHLQQQRYTLSVVLLSGLIDRQLSVLCTINDTIAS